MDIIKQLNINEETKAISLPSLSREEYTQAIGILTRLDIQWNRTEQTHVLSTKSFKKWSAYLNTGKLPKLNPTAFFPTPDEVIDQMLAEYLDEDYVEYLKEYRPNTVRVLEPSAGKGNIAKRARDFFGDSLAAIDTVEFLPENCDVLKANGFTPFNGDFLDFQPTDDYDYILMNPPFSLVSDKYAYITHVEHAMSMLKPNGKLVTILPTGWLTQSNNRIDAFKELCAEYASWEFTQIVERGAFKESGTMVETMIMCLEKNSPLNVEKEHCGWDTPAMWSFNLHSDALMTGDKLACELYEKASNASTRDLSLEYFRSYFLYSKSELAKKGMFYTNKTVNRVIERIVSYEFEEASVLGNSAKANECDDAFELTTYSQVDLIAMETKNKKSVKNIKVKGAKKNLNVINPTERQCEFCW